MSCMSGKVSDHEVEDIMAWHTPKIVEIALGGEINCYACARVK
jgi:coenzyme PQQ precursor peptide PqqA